MSTIRTTYTLTPENVTKLIQLKKLGYTPRVLCDLPIETNKLYIQPVQGNHKTLVIGTLGHSSIIAVAAHLNETRDSVINAIISYHYTNITEKLIKHELNNLHLQVVKTKTNILQIEPQSTPYLANIYHLLDRFIDTLSKI